MTQPNCTCLHCGATFHVAPSVLARGRGVYCTRACSDRARAANTRTCRVCGAEFHTPPSKVRKGQGIYCSARCHGEDARIPPVIRFWLKVAKGEGPDACWLWTAGTSEFGYGDLSLPNGHIGAHRYAWELATGHPAPKGLLVCHVCDVPACVRNDGAGIYVVAGIEYERHGHLFLADFGGNNRDAELKGRKPLTRQRSMRASD